MLIYRKSLGGLPLLLRVTGSSLPRALPPAFISAFLALLFEATISHKTLSLLFEHPYPFQVFGVIVAFSLVFRTNVAYGRFWETRSMTTVMSTKWVTLQPWPCPLKKQLLVKGARRWIELANRRS